VPSFNPLTDQECGCCGLTLGPSDVDARGGLQAVVDSLVGSPAVLSLKSGTYTLAAPLKLGANNAGLTIEGCSASVILAPSGTDMTPFALGLIVADSISGVTLRRLTFSPKPVELDAERAQIRAVLFAVTIGAATTLTIEDCQFNLAAPSPYVLGAGLLMLGATRGARLHRNAFAGKTADSDIKDKGALLGVWAASSAQNVGVSLDQWEIAGNTFSGLAFGVVSYAQLGAIACRNNVVAANTGGLVFIEANLGDTVGYVNEAAADKTNTRIGAVAAGALNAERFSDLIDKAAVIPKADFVTAPPALADDAQQALKVQLSSSGAAAYRMVLLGKFSTDAASPAPTAAPATNLNIAAPPAGGAAPSTSASSAATDQYERIKTIAAYAEAAQKKLTPSLRFTDNDVTLSTGPYTCWTGLGAFLSVAAPGAVMATGNKVIVPSYLTFACALLLPAGCVVSGNLFAQLVAPAEQAASVPALGLLASNPAIMVGSNVCSFWEFVFPAAGNARVTQAATTTWDFLNTTL
jgi:hypothetical protein